MFTNIKPPQHIPYIHTQTTVIVFSKAPQLHTESQEVCSPKTLTPANYLSVCIQCSFYRSWVIMLSYMKSAIPIWRSC